MAVIYALAVSFDFDFDFDFVLLPYQIGAMLHGNLLSPPDRRTQ